MGALIKFELKKILGNRAGMVACALAFALLAALSALNLTSAAVRDPGTGEMVEGVAAQQTLKHVAESHAGMLDDARMEADMEVYDRAVQEAEGVPGFYDLSTQEVIDRYGVEFWQRTDAVLLDDYFIEVSGTLASAGVECRNLQQGALARIGASFAAGFAGYFPYSEAERAFWTAKADGVSWPTEYGYADGWGNVLAWLSFTGLMIVAACIAISGVYAGEYQNRTVAVALPTRRGMRALPLAKALAALLFVTGCWWACAALSIGINVGICGADGWDLPLQVAFGFDNPYPMTVGQAVLALYGLGYLIALGMAALTLLLSAKLRSTMPVAVIPMAIVFLGMVSLFITPLSKVAALTPISGLNWAFGRMASYAAGPFVADLPSVLAVLYGTALVVLSPLAMRAFSSHQVA